MANTIIPQAPQDTFNRDKQWQRVTHLEGCDIEAYDLNEAQDISRYRDFLITANAVGLNTRIGDGFKVVESTENVNKFDVLAGSAVSYGSNVLTSGDHTRGTGERAFYYETTPPNYTNYIVTGKVAQTEPLTSMVIDDDKDFVLDHKLDGCRVLLLSGAESGNSFTIQGSYGAGWGGNSFILDSLGSTGIASGDTYVILPPALTTPSLPESFTTREDLVYLQTWYEDTNDNEDSSMVPTGKFAQTYRTQLRWCVRVAEGYYDAGTNQMVSGALPTASESDNPFGCHYIPIATLSRVSGEPRIFESYIENYRGVELPLGSLSQEMVDLRTSDWYGDHDSAPERLTELENSVKNNKLFNGSFELGNTTNTVIPGWFPSSTAWAISTTSVMNQTRCVAVDHTTRSTTRTETLSSNPFYVRPNQTLRFYGASKGYSSGSTISAKLHIFSENYSFAATPLTTKTLAFGSGDTDWAELEETFTAPSTAQWGYVVLETTGQSGTVYFDDVRVEYLEEAMNNTAAAIPSVEMLGSSFAEGIRGWNVNQLYAQNENVLALVDTLPCVKLTNGGTLNSTEISSWPVSSATCNFFDDTVFLTVKAKYSDLVYGSLTGPFVSVKFFDASFNEVSTANEPISLAQLDWGTSITSASNPDYPSYNSYSIKFSAPASASFFTVQLGLKATSGTAFFSSLNVNRYGTTTAYLTNRTWHDICANGEFGKGYLDTAVTEEGSPLDPNNPPSGLFSIAGWVLTDTNSQFHWKKNSPAISAPSGDRVAEFNVPVGAITDSTGILLSQTINRTITKQDFLHGFILDFDYMYSNPADGSKYELWVDFLDSNKQTINTKTVIDLLDADNPTTLGWTNKIIGIAPPSTSSSYGSVYYNSPVYLAITFRLYQPNTGATTNILRLGGVKLWARSIQTATNILTDDEYVALGGYYTHNTTGHEKEASFYETGLILPSSDNKFLLENDSDLLRKSKAHAHRHYPIATGGTAEADQNVDAIPTASATQTGLVSSTDWAKFNSSLQMSDLSGFLHFGVWEGFFVDQYGYVNPGLALDYSGRRLRLQTGRQLTIPTGADADQWRIDTVYARYNATAVDGVELGIVSGIAGDNNDGDYDPSGDDWGNFQNNLPSDAIILATAIFDRGQYNEESGSTTPDYRTHWQGIGTVGSYSSYYVRQAPRESLANAVNLGYIYTGAVSWHDTNFLATSEKPKILLTNYEAAYEISDVRMPAYRILWSRDTDVVMYYTIGANLVSPEDSGANNYTSDPFYDAVSSSIYNWGDGKPLYGAFTHWDDFLAEFGAILDIDHYAEDGSNDGYHRQVTVPNTSASTWYRLFNKKFTNKAELHSYSYNDTSADTRWLFTTNAYYAGGNWRFNSPIISGVTDEITRGFLLDKDGIHPRRYVLPSGGSSTALEYTYETLTRILPISLSQGAYDSTDIVEAAFTPAAITSGRSFKTITNTAISGLEIEQNSLIFPVTLPPGVIVDAVSVIVKCAAASHVYATFVGELFGTTESGVSDAVSIGDTTSTSWTILTATSVNKTISDSKTYYISIRLGAEGEIAYVSDAKVTYKQYNYLV